MKIQVDSVPGAAGAQEPHGFRLGAQRVGVLEILDRWLAPTHAYFKVRTDDGALYILRHDLPEDHWEITLFRADGSAP